MRGPSDGIFCHACVCILSRARSCRKHLEVRDVRGLKCDVIFAESRLEVVSVLYTV